MSPLPYSVASPAVFSTMGVFIRPGRTAFTRMCFGAYCTAVVRVRWIIAAFGGVVRGIGHTRVADTSDRGNIDDRTPTLFFHDWDDVFHREKAALEVHG